MISWTSFPFAGQMSKSQHTLPPMARLYDAMQQNGRGLRRSSSSRSVTRPPLPSPSSVLVVPPAPPRIRRSTTESSREVVEDRFRGDQGCWCGPLCQYRPTEATSQQSMKTYELRGWSLQTCLLLPLVLCCQRKVRWWIPAVRAAPVLENLIFEHCVLLATLILSDHSLSKFDSFSSSSVFL